MRWTMIERVEARARPGVYSKGGPQREHRAMTVQSTRIAQQRYDQLDYHDARRVAERWWEMLRANKQTGLSEPEMDLRRAWATILTRIRLDATGNYRLTRPQMSFNEVDAA